MKQLIYLFVIASIWSCKEEIIPEVEDIVDIQSEFTGNVDVSYHVVDDIFYDHQGNMVATWIHVDTTLFTSIQVHETNDSIEFILSELLDSYLIPPHEESFVFTFPIDDPNRYVHTTKYHTAERQHFYVFEINPKKTELTFSYKFSNGDYSILEFVGIVE